MNCVEFENGNTAFFDNTVDMIKQDKPNHFENLHLLTYSKMFDENNRIFVQQSVK